MGSGNHQDLLPGDYVVGRTEKEIDDETANAEKEKHFKTKYRKRKRKRKKVCNLPGNQTVNVVREGEARNSLPVLTAKQDVQCK